MRPDPSVTVDPSRGVATLAGHAIEMSSPDAAGALRFGGSAGTLLRALTFAERTDVVLAASTLPSPRDAVAAAVLAVAALELGAGERAPLEVLALWLAGAAWEAPCFSETMLLVAREAGWSPRQLLDTRASEVDRLAVHINERRRGGEWKTLVFEQPPAEDLEALRDRFAGRLLRRSAGTDAAEPGRDEAGPPPDAAAAERRRRPRPAPRSASANGPQGAPLPPLPAPPAATSRAAGDGEGSMVGGRAAPQRFLDHGTEAASDQRVELGPLQPFPFQPFPVFRLDTPGVAREALSPTRAGAEGWTTVGCARESVPGEIEGWGLDAGTRATTAPHTHSVPTPADDGVASIDGLTWPLPLVTRAPAACAPQPGMRETPDTIHDTKASDAFELARRLAALLDDEADLRGADR